MKTFLLTLTLCCLCASAQAHKCVGADGKTLYTDMPCPTGQTQVGGTQNAQDEKTAQPEAQKLPDLKNRQPTPEEQAKIMEQIRKGAAVRY
jgi:hypothetical protein